MAINQNHPFEEIDGVRCAIVEKNCTPARVEFLKSLLELNGYTVVVVTSPPPKTPPAKPLAEGETPPPPPPPAPETFTVAVTQNEFNVTNAIYGRLLRTKEGNVVTMKYWKQQETVSNDSKPYFAKTWR
ncbi:MAG: hypothetical protein KIS94_03115 [Chitinophagales bacterium]|nr:hypothetical protein [Chitinophagales bacterium]